MMVVSDDVLLGQLGGATWSAPDWETQVSRAMAACNQKAIDRFRPRKRLERWSRHDTIDTQTADAY